MRGRRRARLQARAEAAAQAQAQAAADVEAQAALAVADAHAEAGLDAQVNQKLPNGVPINGFGKAPEMATWAPPGSPPLQLDVTPPVPAVNVEMQAEFLRVLEVVTRMCDHVIEYIEADRTERRVMVETMAELARAITSTQAPITVDPEPALRPERVIGGSMDAGPEPVIDLRETEPAIDLRQPEPEPHTRVEVRCKFGEGERWVDGFEIVDVLANEEGPMYRLRRQRDGVILPQLFDAASIRHVETFEELSSERRTTWSKL